MCRTVQSQRAWDFLIKDLPTRWPGNHEDGSPKLNHSELGRLEVRIDHRDRERVEAKFEEILPLIYPWRLRVRTRHPFGTAAEFTAKTGALFHRDAFR